MAKLKAPLLSLGASGQIGKSLVFFPWKGVDAVREYVVPANPKSAGQLTQRGYLTDAVAAVHAVQALAVGPLNAGDLTGYALLASVFKAAQTWFNEVVRQFVNQRVAALFGCIYRDATTSVGDGVMTPAIDFSEDADSVNSVTAGNFHYGTSKTAMVNTIAAVIAGDNATANIAGLTNGTKYYWQFRATLHADFVGTRSGIYHGTPSA